MTPTLRLITAENKLTITVDGTPWLKLAVGSEDNSPVVQLLAACNETIFLDDQDVLPQLHELIVDWDKLIRDEEMGLPRWERHRIQPPETPTQRRIRSTRSNGVVTVTSSEVEAILDAIVETYVKEPQQSRQRVSELSHVIAKKLDVGIMQVAGVRANLKRGAYDQTLEQMVVARRKIKVR